MRWSCRMNSEKFFRRRRSANGVVTLVSTILIFLSFERTFIEKKLRWCRKIIIMTRIRTLRRWYLNSRPFLSMTECWRNCLQYLQFFFGGWSIFRWWRGCCQWTWVRKDATETVTVVRIQMSVSIQLHRDHKDITDRALHCCHPKVNYCLNNLLTKLHKRHSVMSEDEV